MVNHLVETQQKRFEIFFNSKERTQEIISELEAQKFSKPEKKLRKISESGQIWLVLLIFFVQIRISCFKGLERKILNGAVQLLL